MSQENLWGELPDAQSLVLPQNILKQQASFLGKMTGNLIEAKVTKSIVPSRAFSYALEIFSSALAGYSIRILQIDYDITIYPLELHDMVNQKKYGVGDEKELFHGLKVILQSENVKKVLSSVLAHAKAK